MGLYRGLDTKPGWINRRFRDLQGRQVRGFAARSLEGSSVTLPTGEPGPVTETIVTGGTRFRNRDTFIATGPGTQTFTLTYVPLEGSLQVWWGGIPQSPTEWGRAGATVTIPDPDSRIKAGHVFSAYYAYDSLSPEPVPLQNPLPESIDFGSEGWAWIQLTKTDATDYSAADFDDSGWEIAQGAFGQDYGGAFPAPATVWTQDTRMWARRRFFSPAGVDRTLGVRVDREAVVYLNGTLIDTVTSDGSTDESVTLPAAAMDASGTQVLAVRATGDGLSGDYFDLAVS